MEVNSSPIGDDVTGHPGVGWTLLILGILGIARLIVEYVTVIAGMGTNPEAIYYPVVGIDALLAAFLGLAGIGILKRRPWAASVGIATLSAWLINSLGLFAGLWLPAILPAQGLGLLILWILSPRFLYYLVSLVSAPFLIRWFLLLQTPASVRRRRLWQMAGSALLSGLAVALILVIRRALKK